MTNETLLKQIAKASSLVFFGTEGLTSSAANHKCNLIKEFLRSKENEWTKTGAYNQKLDFGSREIVIANFDKIDLVQATTVHGDYNALVAWLREGVKAKDNILTIVRSAAVASFVLADETIDAEIKEEIESIQYPTAPRLKFKEVTEDDILATWSIAQRAEYYAIQSQAAAIGQRIHGGEISKLRNSLGRMKAFELTEMAKDGGQTTVLVTNTPVYTVEELDKIYFDLQEQHRSLEQRLNYLKAQLQDAVNSANVAARAEYAEETRIAQTAFANASRESESKLQALRAKLDQRANILEKRRVELTNYISGLKIVVPNALQGIMDDVEQNLGGSN